MFRNTDREFLDVYTDIVYYHIYKKRKIDKNKIYRWLNFFYKCESNNGAVIDLKYFQSCKLKKV